MLKRKTFLEFFAGGGMVRAGLGPDWDCIFANDFSGKKALSYQANWGTGGELFVGDIADVELSDLEAEASLAWASFPCQDLSLAGRRLGLTGRRSGTFFEFWKLIQLLKEKSRAPKIIALENVCGALSSNGGHDFRQICHYMTKNGYRVGALVINASLFVPQSRPRLFIVGINKHTVVPEHLCSPEPILPFHTKALRRSHAGFDDCIKSNWIWWNLPIPAPRSKGLKEIIEDNPSDINWHTKAQTNQLIDSMSPANLAKMSAAMHAKRLVVGTVYKRTRPTENGRMVRSEVRFDNIAGCLRTPNGGSSRQIIMVVDGENVKTRLISGRETARLMGLNDSYILPKNYNETYHLTGDGVAVPVVSFLSQFLFDPLLVSIHKNYHSETNAADLERTVGR